LWGSSAVKSTTNPGYYESKWGQLAVVRHTKTGVPYADPTNSVNYYASTKITNNISGLFCSGTRTFSVKAITGATYVWTNSSGVIPTGSANQSSFTVQRNGTSEGASWVEVQISTPCSSVPKTSRANFTVGSPLTIAASQTGGCSGVYQMWNLSANPFVNGSNYQWTVSYLGTNSQITIYSPTSATTNVNVKGGGTVKLSYTDACGVIRNTSVTVYSNCGSHSFALVVSPNPTNENINLTFNQQIVDTSSNSKLSVQEAKPINSLESSGKTIVTLYEFNTGAFVKQWIKKEIISKTYNFNIPGLRKGLYILQVDRDNQTVTTKVIVE
jgi:hypothetical protein